MMKHPCGSEAVFCVCDVCIAAKGREHAAADARCGRKWVCQCGACRRARVISAEAVAEIETRLCRIEDLERRLKSVRNLKQDGK